MSFIDLKISFLPSAHRLGGRKVDRSRIAEPLARQSVETLISAGNFNIDLTYLPYYVCQRSLEMFCGLSLSITD